MVGHRNGVVCACVRCKPVLHRVGVELGVEVLRRVGRCVLLRVGQVCTVVASLVFIPMYIARF